MPKYYFRGETTMTNDDLKREEAIVEEKEILSSSAEDNFDEEESGISDDSQIEDHIHHSGNDAVSDDESDIEDDQSEKSEEQNSTSILYSNSIRDDPSEIEKGKAVRNQLALWEILLECRITMQQCLAASNRLPEFKKYDHFWTQLSQDDKNSVIECREKVWDLLEKLIYSQNKLRQQCPEFLETINKRKVSDDDEVDCEMQKTKRKKLTEYPEILQKQFDDYSLFRNDIVQKWNDRTKIASGKFAKSNFSAFDQPILKQIEQIMSDKRRLIQRTYVKRSHYRIIGEDVAEKEDESSSNKKGEVVKEIYDDDDFYQKLLRDYIAQKTSDISDPTQLGRKLVHLQKLRTKMKKPVDPRRTKGRKINFDFHPKLVNFMVPVTVDRWGDTAINELFNSVIAQLKLTKTSVHRMVHMLVCIKREFIGLES